MSEMSTSFSPTRPVLMRRGAHNIAGISCILSFWSRDTRELIWIIFRQVPGRERRRACRPALAPSEPNRSHNGSTPVAGRWSTRSCGRYCSWRCWSGSCQRRPTPSRSVRKYWVYWLKVKMLNCSTEVNKTFRLPPTQANLSRIVQIYYFVLCIRRWRLCVFVCVFFLHVARML